MVILITIGILLLTAFALLILRFAAPDFRFSWLTATGGSLLAWISALAWQANIPTQLQFSIWKPEALFSQSPAFQADGTAWAFTLSIVTLCLAIIVTSVVRSNFPSPLSWIANLTLTALGVLAVTADNPLTLVLIWAAIDLVELIVQLRFVEEPNLNERVVIAFGSRVMGTLILLWASVVGAASGGGLEFHLAVPQAGLYLLVASSLRLGVLPMHLPYPSESAMRRGFGTSLRMISAASSLILLARIPAEGIASSLTPYLLVLVALAGVYGGWMWLRSPDELSGRPFWLIGMGALAVASALRGNPVGAAAWGCALVLCGGVLFLSSEPNRWMIRALWIAAFGMSALPYSISATGWISQGGFFVLAWAPLVLAHALLLAGFLRHIQRPATARVAYDDQPVWAKNIYPIGISLILFTILFLGWIGWEGASVLGNPIPGLIASLLAFSLLWFTPRLRILNPVRAHWVRPSNPRWVDWTYRFLWGLYRQAGRLSNGITNLLEGESGLMWTLLFLALFISYYTQRIP